MTSSEGVDRIALNDLATGRYLTAPAAPGKVTAGGTTAGPAESFDWGAGRYTLRAAANGKYPSYSGGALVNDADQPTGWFAQQQLKLDPQPDGSSVLEYAGNEVTEPWFGPDRYAVVGADGILTISAPDAAHATKFGRDMLRGGVSDAVAAARGADTAVVVVGSMPFITGRATRGRKPGTRSPTPGCRASWTTTSRRPA
ncbi:hypothetical protein [Amycolatopsis sp. NPDC004378]